MATKIIKNLKTKQKGNILVIFTVGLFAMITVSSLALDGGHLLLNKGKLQNLVDAAALHAATELDEGSTHKEARFAVVEMLRLNISHNDHHELADAIDLSDANINTDANQITTQLAVEFSQEPDPFTGDLDESAKYVKVSLSQLNLNNFLANIFNFNKQVSATALAGPSSDISSCYEDLVPMAVCGDKNDTSDTSEYGFEKGSLNLLKTGSNSQSAIGPGNFQLIRLGDNKGGNDILGAMAGEYGAGTACFTKGANNSSVPTETGNKVGPAANGINTRMGLWEGSLKKTSKEHLRDSNICEGDTIIVDKKTGEFDELDAEDKAYRYTNYEQYKTGVDITTSCDAFPSGDIIPETSSTGEQASSYGRRILQVVIVDCGTSNINGQNDLDFLDIGCFFMTQKMGHTGNTANVIGEFINSGGNCTNGGTPSITPVDNNGPYKIVLYHVPGSSDS
ncbi:Tad domain-containing protein [Moritella dasanensis]|uniref:Tad domain-containing protein n=1 Tax=Moritella dasanensis TaxID=428031 RepID=UPI00030A2C55|nr:Tad domain-containing protein [Moritella dasanensis]